MQSKKQLKSNVEKHIEPGFKRAGTDWLHMCTHVALLYCGSILILQGQGIFPVRLSWKKHMGGRHLCEGKLVLFGKADYDFQRHRGKKSTAENLLSWPFSDFISL